MNESEGGGGVLPSGCNISNEVLLGYDNTMPRMFVPCFFSVLLTRIFTKCCLPVAACRNDDDDSARFVTQRLFCGLARSERPLSQVREASGNTKRGSRIRFVGTGSYMPMTCLAFLLFHLRCETLRAKRKQWEVYS